MTAPPSYGHGTDIGCLIRENFSSICSLRLFVSPLEENKKKKKKEEEEEDETNMPPHMNSKTPPVVSKSDKQN